MIEDDWPYEHTEERMAIAAVAPRTEPELLAAIDHQDHATRAVYADWLEEQGDDERAEYVRLQDQLLALPAGTPRTQAVARIKALDARHDAAWRILVARTPIQNCERTGCPGDWGSLAPAERADVRACMQCHVRVRYCVGWPAREHDDVPLAIDGHYERDWLDSRTTGEWPRPRRG